MNVYTVPLKKPNIKHVRAYEKNRLCEKHFKSKQQVKLEIKLSSVKISMYHTDGNVSFPVDCK